jgi:uncharacterized protein YfaP (DUF2135 family)
VHTYTSVVTIVLGFGLLTCACQPATGGGRRSTTGPTFRTSLAFGDQLDTGFVRNTQTTVTARVVREPSSTVRNVVGMAVLDKTSLRVTKTVNPGRVVAQALPDRLDLTFLIAGPDDDPCASSDVIGTFTALYNAAGTDFTVTPASLDLTSSIAELILDGSLSVCVRVNANFDGSVRINALSVSFRQVSTTSGPTGTLTGTVVDAQSGSALSGATIAVSGSSASAVSDSNGMFRIEAAPAGDRTVTASATGYVPTSTPVTIVANDTTEISVGLLQSSASGDSVQAILTWGEAPADLDLHLSGPDSAGGRFHAFYRARQPVAYVCLDLDDTSSFGPETMTIARASTGQFVAGDYHVWVHNFSQTPEFDVSGAVLTLFAAGRQIAQFQVDSATGDRSLDIWRVVEFNLSADGSVSGVRAVQSFAAGNADSVF